MFPQPTEFRRQSFQSPGPALRTTLAARWVAGVVWVAAAVSPALSASKRCDWHGPKTRGETSYKQCVDYAALNGKTLDLPANVSRISHDGISFCANAFKGSAGAADIVYMMDNSGSMEKGENSGGFNTPPGDPFGIRDRVIRRAMRQQRATADTSTAGFISFFGLGGNQDYTVEPELEKDKLQRPLDISRINAAGETNLNTLLRKVWKHNPNEALLPKVSAEAKVAKKALTYWSEALLRANSWFKPESGFVKTKNHAIVMVSDGAIGDWKDVQALASKLPPVYGIHLGGDVNAQHLKDLCALTNGQFFLVSPTDTAAFSDMMARIVGIITKNPLPNAVKVVNKTLAPPQTSTNKEMIANPDGSLGIVLDSIIGLKAGVNQIEIQIGKDDNTTTTWNFGLNVAAPEITAGSGNYSCYDMPRLSVIDAAGDSVEVYSKEAVKQTVQLTRSPSELRGVTLAVDAEGGDKENLPIKDPSSALGFPIHRDDIKFNGKDASPTSGNGTVEVGNSGNVTLAWSHPRDPRETATYILLGKKVPVVIASVNLSNRDTVTRGVTIQNPPKGDPVVILDRNGRCQTNCSGAETIVMKDNGKGIPSWNALIRSPVRLTMRIYDNLGQFVNESRQEFTAAQWDALPKEGDSARVSIHYIPISKSGQNLGTGAYLMKMEVVGLGGLVRNAAGEMVELKTTRQQYINRFGYVRQ